MTTTEAVACGIVVIPMLTTLVLISFSLIERGLTLARIDVWRRFKYWMWKTVPLTAVEHERFMREIFITMGITLIVVPMLTVLLYSYAVEQMSLVDYIIKSWGEVTLSI
jgi:hypothetical protein